MAPLPLPRTVQRKVHKTNWASLLIIPSPWMMKNNNLRSQLLHWMKNWKRKKLINQITDNDKMTKFYTGIVRTGNGFLPFPYF